MDCMTLRKRRNRSGSRGRRDRGKERSQSQEQEDWSRNRERGKQEKSKRRSRCRERKKEKEKERPGEQLLAIGEGDFFVSCLLHLSPEDLKACRLVNKTWNKVIKERVWGSKRARKRLEQKLLDRWKTTNPETARLSTVPRGITAISTNSSHIFCGLQDGKVKVFRLTDGQWVRDLESGEEDFKVERICGGESIVAAGWLAVVTIWSSKEEMGQLHSFDVRNHDGLEGGVVWNIIVSRNKVVLLLRDQWSTHQLVVIQEFGHNWENKILEPIFTPIWNKVAVDKDWLAVKGWEESGQNILKVKLWKEEMFQKDIELPGVMVDGYKVNDVVLESPFLIVGGTGSPGDKATGWIKVFQLAAGKYMEDINSAASLVKTLQFPGFYAPELLRTGLVWGCLLTAVNRERFFALFEKTVLLDSATLPEETGRNMIHLDTTNYSLVDMNTTSLVFIRRVPVRENRRHDYLCKKDFWISRTNTA